MLKELTFIFFSLKYVGSYIKGDTLMDIGLYFKFINHKIESRMNCHLKKNDLTFSQFQVMAFLAHNCECDISQKKICDFLKVKHTSIIDVLKRLEAKGFIQRKTNSLNARSNCVTLTESGKKLMNEMKLERQYVNDLIYKDFTEEEKTQLERLLQKVLENIENGDDANA